MRCWSHQSCCCSEVKNIVRLITTHTIHQLHLTLSLSLQNIYGGMHAPNSPVFIVTIRASATLHQLRAFHVMSWMCLHRAAIEVTECHSCYTAGCWSFPRQNCTSHVDTFCVMRIGCAFSAPLFSYTFCWQCPVSVLLQKDRLRIRACR